jgi:hypothetical protein
MIMPISQTKKKSKSSPAISISSRLEAARRIIGSNWPDLFFARYFHQTVHGDPLSFGRGRSALIPLYKDDSQELAIMKAVQLGISDRAIIATLTRLHRGWKVLYSFPTEQFRNEMISERIDPLLMSVPFYRHGLKHSRGEKDEAGMKHIWGGTARFVGSNSKVAFVGFAADMVIVDEKDKSDQRNLKLAPDRLDASEHKYFWQLGNPTYPKIGIHADYLKSDQKVWHIKCSHCNEWQPLDFFVNVVEKTSDVDYRLLDKKWKQIDERDIALYCRKCHREIDRLADGEHVARYPGRDISGYHFSQIFSPTKTIRDIYAQFLEGLTDPSIMEIVYNSRLGLPYAGSGDKLSAALLDAKCADDYLMPDNAEDCTAGIDVNWPQLHVRISDYPAPGIRRAVYIGTVTSFKELSDLFERYGVKCAVMDFAPERHKVREFQSQHPRVLWAAEYSSSEIADFWRIDEESRLITVDRTQSIDERNSAIYKGHNILPKNFRTLDNGEYIKQMEAPTRRFDDKRQKPRYIWDEGNEEDHHFHADNFDYLAMRIKAINSFNPGMRSAKPRETAKDLGDFSKPIRSKKGMDGFL